MSVWAVVCLCSPSYAEITQYHRKEDPSLCRLLHWTKQGRCNATTVCDLRQPAFHNQKRLWCIPQQPQYLEWHFTNTLSSQMSFKTMEWHNNIILYWSSYMTVAPICSQGRELADPPLSLQFADIFWHYFSSYFEGAASSWELLFKSCSCGSHA